MKERCPKKYTEECLDYCNKHPPVELTTYVPPCLYFPGKETHTKVLPLLYNDVRNVSLDVYVSFCMIYVKRRARERERERERDSHIEKGVKRVRAMVSEKATNLSILAEQSASGSRSQG